MIHVAGVRRVWPKTADLRSAPVGVHRFKSCHLHILLQLSCIRKTHKAGVRQVWSTSLRLGRSCEGIRRFKSFHPHSWSISMFGKWNNTFWLHSRCIMVAPVRVQLPVTTLPEKHWILKIPTSDRTQLETRSG